MFNTIVSGFFYYLISTSIVAIGLMFSVGYLKSYNNEAISQHTNPIDSCIQFDGRHYRDIAYNGYTYDPQTRSLVAFFPAYPLLVRELANILQIRIEFSLIIVSNLFLLLTFFLLAIYGRLKSESKSAFPIDRTLLAFGLWPSTFFFRMAYPESMFLATALITLIGIHRQWPLLLTAFFAGLSTATRPVGIAVAVAFLWAVFRQPGRRLWKRSILIISLAPIAGWGLISYMIYQEIAFNNLFAFAQTQENWKINPPILHPTLNEKAEALLTFSPIVDSFDSGSRRYWAKTNRTDGILFNFFFWNPVLFLLSTGLLILGAVKKWLTGPETILGVALIAIPYCTRSYEMTMASHARFAAAVIVIYPVLGKILSYISTGAFAAIVMIFSAFLLCWSALYTSGHLLF